MTDPIPDTKNRLLDAALMHVAFDGWTDATFDAAVADTGVDPVVARGVCPRGAVDLAVAYHKRGDQQMIEVLAGAGMDEMRIRDKITFAVRTRLEQADDKEAVRRGTTLFSLPQYAPDGARLIWDTCDAIWTAIGDPSVDINWYSKRATLSGVYGSTVLFWLGDESAGSEATWEFLDRRIENVMSFEKFKAQARKNPFIKAFMDGPGRLLEGVKAPNKDAAAGLPGRWNEQTKG